MRQCWEWWVMEFAFHRPPHENLIRELLKKYPNMQSSDFFGCVSSGFLSYNFFGRFKLLGNESVYLGSYLDRWRDRTPNWFFTKKNFKVKSYLPRDPKLTESSFHFSESSSCCASWLCFQKISKRWPSHSPLGLTNLIVVTRIKLGIVDASVHQTSSDCGFLQIRWCKHSFEDFFFGANKICQSFCKQKYMYCIWSNSMTSISPSVFWVKPRFFLVLARHRQIGSNGGVRRGTSCFWHTSFVECWEMG